MRVDVETRILAEARAVDEQRRALRDEVEAFRKEVRTLRRAPLEVVTNVRETVDGYLSNRTADFEQLLRHVSEALAAFNHAVDPETKAVLEQFAADARQELIQSIKEREREIIEQFQYRLDEMATAVKAAQKHVLVYREQATAQVEAESRRCEELWKSDAEKQLREIEEKRAEVSALEKSIREMARDIDAHRDTASRARAELLQARDATNETLDGFREQLRQVKAARRHTESFEAESLANRNSLLSELEKVLAEAIARRDALISAGTNEHQTIQRSIELLLGQLTMEFGKAKEKREQVETILQEVQQREAASKEELDQRTATFERAVAGLESRLDGVRCRADEKAHDLDGTVASSVEREFARQWEELVRTHEEQLQTTRESSAQQVATFLKTKEAEIEELLKRMEDELQLSQRATSACQELVSQLGSPK
jgi:HAMP domain-containing protein